MHIAADVGVVGVERSVGRPVAEPVRVVVVWRWMLPKQHLPQSRVKIPVNGVECGLGGDVGTVQALVMVVRILVINNLCHQAICSEDSEPA